MENFQGPVDRRRRSDGIMKLVSITSAMGWILVTLCSMLTIYAKPEQTNLFYEMFNIPVRSYWNYSLLDTVFALLIVLLMISLFGILLNTLRHRRKTDRIKKSLIFQASMSVLGIVILWINSVI